MSTHSVPSTLSDHANALITCIYLPDVRKNEHECASVCVHVCTRLNGKCVFSGILTCL